MRKFILALFYFCLPVIILSFPIDYLLSNKLKEVNNYATGENLVWNDIYRGEIDDEIFIYGSSRAWTHINPQLLEEELGRTSYNFGMDGQNFDMQNLRNQELMAYNLKPKYIIYSLDVHTLGKSSGLYNDIQFLPYMLMNDNLYDYLSSFKSFNYFDFYLPLIRYAGKGEIILKQSISSETSKPTRVKGYKGMDKVWNDDLKNAMKKIDVFEIEIDLSLVEKFNLFLDKSKINNIEVVFVYTPEYIEGQKFVANRNEIITLYEKIAKKHDILFLNYSDDEINAQKKYFYNASHLNKNGAELFTNKLIEDLIRTNKQTGIYNKGSL